MTTSGHSEALEKLYSDMDNDDHEPRSPFSRSPSLSLTFDELEGLYTAFARAGSGRFTLSAVERIARDRGLWPIQLDIVCSLRQLTKRRSGGGRRGAVPEFGEVELTAFSGLSRQEPRGLAAEDVVSLVRLVLGGPVPSDVFATVSVDELHATLSPRALRALDLRDLRVILEGMSSAFNQLHGGDGGAERLTVDSWSAGETGMEKG